MPGSRFAVRALAALTAGLGLVAGDLPYATAGQPAESNVAYARHLALSPDGQMLAFAWAGDLWSVPIGGGTALRLTAHPAGESHPIWSPDGRQIAFASDRHGADCIFLMNADGSDIRRITFGDRSEIPTAFWPDGESIVFHSRQTGEVMNEPRVYRVPVAGGQPWRVIECGAAQAAISPDGKQIAFTRGYAPWWRRGYRGSGNVDIWTCELATGRFEQRTDWPGNDRNPRWDATGSGLYFLSDRGSAARGDTPARPAGVFNVWYQPASGAARQLTRATDDDIRDYTISASGNALAYTQWDGIFIQSPPDAQPRRLMIRAGDDSPARPIELERFTRNATEFEVSPNGKEIALVVRGEIFVTKTEPDRLTRRVTESPARDHSVTWSPDGKALFFVSDAAGQEDIYRATSAETPSKALSDSLRFRIERVTDHPQVERSPAVAPDGKTLAFTRHRGDLILRDLASGEERTLLESWNAPGFRWSPDSRWIAYDVSDHEYNADVWIVPADGSTPAVNISRHPDSDRNANWSADGQILAFTSRREGHDSDLYLVFLSPDLDDASPVELREYFDAAAEQAKKRTPPKDTVASGTIRLAGQPASAPATQAKADRPKREKPASDENSIRRGVRSLLKNLLEEPTASVPARRKPVAAGDDAKEDSKTDKVADKKSRPWQLESAWQRIRRVTALPADQSNFVLAPDGATLVFVSSHEGEAALFSIKWNGEDRKRLSSGAAGGLHWTLSGDRLFYISGGVPSSLKAGGGDAKTHTFSAKMAIDRVAEAEQKFNDASRALSIGFYHPTMKGLDWPGLTDRYRGLALRTRTWDEFNEIFNLLQGELNASHQGTSGPGRGGVSDSIGYLGIECDPIHAGPGLRVASITPRGPADRTESRLYPGDVLLRVGGIEVGPNRSLAEALVNSVGDEMIVVLQPGPQRLAAERATPASAPAEPPAEENAGKQPGEDIEPTSSSPQETPAETAATSAPAESGDSREIVIRPISYGAYSSLQYRAWVEANARYVEEKSAGRVGYLHIQGMGEPQFNTFERDLYAVGHGKDGIIIDVRNNGGGWTADWVMAVLSVRRHAYTVSPGGKPGYPQDRLIFYAWTKPATMMCNQHSFSNAEIVSHAFQALGRGPLVGVPTFGGVISTGSYGLVDGATIRMPGRGWFRISDGKDMENNGAVPDVIVPQTPDDEVNGREPQLDAAIAETLRQIAP